MEFSELEQLAEIVQKANIRELTLKQGANRLVLRKAPPVEISEESTALVPIHGVYAETSFPFNGIRTDAEYKRDEIPLSTESHRAVWVSAPSVGIFRHVKPIIGLGARVKPGQTLGVIEAMNLRSEIPAPIEGIITDVFAEDGLPVEYGHPLFAIDPESGL
jgi:acetyl-CoA carboxylase biotin carboxyl carrier protein